MQLHLYSTYGLWRWKRLRLGLRAGVWLQAKVRDRGLGCGLGCTPALSLTTASLRRHMRRLWCVISERYLYLLIVFVCHVMCTVSGDWSVWSSWSECSSRCGRGFRRRTRTCLYGVAVDPADGAALPCHGDTSQRSVCTGSCRGPTRGSDVKFFSFLITERS